MATLGRLAGLTGLLALGSASILRQNSTWGGYEAEGFGNTAYPRYQPREQQYGVFPVMPQAAMGSAPGYGRQMPTGFASDTSSRGSWAEEASLSTADNGMPMGLGFMRHGGGGGMGAEDHAPMFGEIDSKGGVPPAEIMNAPTFKSFPKPPSIPSAGSQYPSFRSMRRKHRSRMHDVAARHLAEAEAYAHSEAEAEEGTESEEGLLAQLQELAEEGGPGGRSKLAELIKKMRAKKRHAHERAAAEPAKRQKPLTDHSFKQQHKQQKQQQQQQQQQKQQKQKQQKQQLQQQQKERQEQLARQQKLRHTGMKKADITPVHHRAGGDNVAAAAAALAAKNTYAQPPAAVSPPVVANPYDPKVKNTPVSMMPHGHKQSNEALYPEATGKTEAKICANPGDPLGCVEVMEGSAGRLRPSYVDDLNAPVMSKPGSTPVCTGADCGAVGANSDTYLMDLQFRKHTSQLKSDKVAVKSVELEIKSLQARLAAMKAKVGKEAAALGKEKAAVMKAHAKAKALEKKSGKGSPAAAVAKALQEKMAKLRAHESKYSKLLHKLASMKGSKDALSDEIGRLKATMAALGKQ